MSKTLVESDYRISVALPKTHDFIIATLSIKNIVVGGLVKGEKGKIHQGYKAINLNIARLAKHVMPHLGIIDGFVGMEGKGPVSGDPVNLRVAAASFHPVSLDAVMCRIMGFNPLDIGYLYYLDKWGMGVADLNKIEINVLKRNHMVTKITAGLVLMVLSLCIVSSNPALSQASPMNVVQMALVLDGSTSISFDNWTLILVEWQTP